jgi:branched-chain amino acid transport system ATP-binding protein
MSVPLLRVAGLCAGYGRAEVLHGLDMQCAEGSIVTVIGPNGAGKSTLLNTIMGLLPGRGSIEFDGRPVGQLTLEARVMLGIALVPEKRELFSVMSVEDNLLLGAYRQRRLRKHDWKARMQDVFALFPRLRERRTQLAGTLSGGERQMLALGRALMSQPRLLLLDEPSLGLAPLVVREIFATIKALREQGVTTVLVEQNARAALEVADHGYLLEMGELQLEGPANELAHDRRVIDSYLGAARAGG